MEERFNDGEFYEYSAFLMLIIWRMAEHQKLNINLEL